jgi:hypothetical protein
MSKKKEPTVENSDDIFRDLYGIDPEDSLLSVNFATTENSYLNEHYQEVQKDQEE